LFIGTILLLIVVLNRIIQHLMSWGDSDTELRGDNDRLSRDLSLPSLSALENLPFRTTNVMSITSNNNSHTPNLESVVPESIALPTTPAISSIQTSATMAATYQYEMPIPGTQGVSFFSGRNVTEFLERYEDICDDARIIEADRIRRLPRYCDQIHAQIVKEMQGYVDKDWKKLADQLKEEFRSDDAFQVMTSMAYLQELKDKKRTMDDNIRQYAREYTAASGVLMKKGQLTEYMRGAWFLHGLLEKMRNKIVTKRELRESKPEKVIFYELVKTTNNLLEANDATEEFEKLGEEVYCQTINRF
jgi:hypothetical protein